MPPRLMRRASHRPGLTTDHDGTWLTEEDTRESQVELRERQAREQREVREQRDAEEDTPRHVQTSVSAGKARRSPPRRSRAQPVHGSQTAEEPRQAKFRLFTRRLSQRPGLTTDHDGTWLPEEDARESLVELREADDHGRWHAGGTGSPPNQPRRGSGSSAGTPPHAAEHAAQRRGTHAKQAPTQRPSTAPVGGRYAPQRAANMPSMQLLVEGRGLHAPHAPATDEKEEAQGLSAEELADEAAADAVAAAWVAGRTRTSATVDTDNMHSPSDSPLQRSRGLLASITEDQEVGKPQPPPAAAVHLVPTTMASDGGAARLAYDHRCARVKFIRHRNPLQHQVYARACVACAVHQPAARGPFARQPRRPGLVGQRPNRQPSSPDGGVATHT